MNKKKLCKRRYSGKDLKQLWSELGTFGIFELFNNKK